MKKLFQKLLGKLIKKAVKKAVSNNEVDVPEMEPVVSDAGPADDSKKALWKFVIQTLISILTAILTALGATSCMGIH
jgi:hypothetical protein